MVGDESTQKAELPKWAPDRLQQILNRLYKYYEHLNFEDRRPQIARDIKKMELTDEDRHELLRRLD